MFVGKFALYNQVLVECIPIAVIAVHLNLASLVSHLIRCIAITY